MSDTDNASINALGSGRCIADSPAHTGFNWLLGSAVVCGAIIGLLGADPARAFSEFPWQPIAIFIALEMFTGLVVQTGAFDKLAVLAATIGQGKSTRLIYAFAVLLMLVGVANNNMTALVIAFPILMPALASTRPDNQTVRQMMSGLLAVGNCSGAATPIGDFPAIMIMATGLISFTDYLRLAFPLFLVTAAVVTTLHAGLLAVHARREKSEPTEASVALMLLQARHRNRAFDKTALLRLGLVFATMVAAWMLLPVQAVPPALVAWAGLAIAAVAVRDRGLVPQSVSFNFDPIVRLAGIYFAASLLATTHAVTVVTDWVVGQHTTPFTLVLVVMGVTLVASAVLDAGGAAAALLPVLARLATGAGPLASARPIAVVAFAAAICAGSSLMLTSATAGHLMASKVAAADLQDPDGNRIVFGFRSYIWSGLSNAAVQAAIAVGAVALLFHFGT